MAVNFSQFTSSTTIAGTDQLVGYTNTSPGGERRWSYTDLANSISTTVTNNINTTITQSLTSPTGSYRIRKLADSIDTSYYVGAAITVDEEVIIWGNIDIYYTGHLGATSTRTPLQAISIPFLTNPTANAPIENRNQILNLKKQGKTIVQLYQQRFITLVLLSDGTVWCRAYQDTANTYNTGWTTAELAGVTAKYPTGLYQITQWDWTNPALANKIVDIQLAYVSQHGSYGALDSAGDLHIWGHFNPKWGSSHDIKIPTNITKGNPNLQGKIKDFQITGNNTARSVQIITTTGEIWGFGYNGYGQLGNNTVTASTGWVRANYVTTPTGTTLIPVANASKLVRQRSRNYTNLGYISTTGSPSVTQNTLFISGYEHDTHSIKSTTTTTNVFVPGTNGASPVNDSITQAVMNGYRAYPGLLYATSTGRVFSAGYHAWGELGRAGVTLGPSFQEVDVVNPMTGVKVKFGTTSGIIAKQIIPGLADNANANAIIATMTTSPYGPTHNYVFLSGYRGYADLENLGVESAFIFVPLAIKESVEEVLFGADSADNHQYTFIRCTGGRVYGLGYSASGTFQQTDGYCLLPVPIF